MTTLQVAILFPAVLLWLMLIVQYGLWWHAKQVANAAAAEAVAAAQTPTGTEADGDVAAHRFIDQSSNLTNVAVVVSRRPDVVVAEIRGDAPCLVPGFDWSVTARSYAPVERFLTETER
jgi:Flp pilus assembly protein TadG